MSPPRSAWVEEDRPTSVSVVGVGRHPSLRPILAASILSGWGPQAEAMAFPLSIPPETSLATVFQDEGRLDELASLLRETRGETVLLPALFSLRDYGSLERLERRCGRRLLEAVTPLGIPGLRFLEVLQTGAMTAGAEIWPGRRVIALSMKGDTVTGAEVTGGLETRRLEVDALLLATGGPLADGLSLTNKGLADPFGLFRLSSPENTEAGGYAHQAGRLVSRSGAKIVNAFGAGNCLATPNRRYGQGLTEALDSAWSATQAMEGP
jgi:hypothetical protein